jgi:hypothetical protein
MSDNRETILTDLNFRNKAFSEKGSLHHVFCDGEVLWKLGAAMDHHGVEAVQKLVPKKLILLPVLFNIF